MPEAAVSALSGWESFYVIVGTSAAALTGLQFVVITLIAGVEGRRSGEAIAAFGSPTIVHFGSALLVSAIVSAPWPELWPAAVLLCLCGLGGVTYVGLVNRRARRQQDYQPVREDWLWHVILPLVAYIVLFVAAILLFWSLTLTFFGVGAVAVLFLFIGIHNAWDNVTYITIDQYQQKNKGQDNQP